MVTPGTGQIVKTTREFQVRLPFLPQAKRRGRVKAYLYVGLIVSDEREFCPGFPEEYPGIDHRHSPDYRCTGDGHRHKMLDATKCGVFRPGEDAAAIQRESLGLKNGAPVLVDARNESRHSPILTPSSGFQVQHLFAWPG